MIISYKVSDGMQLLTSIPDPGSLQIVAPSAGQRKRAETCSTGAKFGVIAALQYVLCNILCVVAIGRLAALLREHGRT